ncbi:MAG TPA: ABC transporter ATP-binding protein [Candidatus Baltobacteraceae bacterium]|nr:ABC transporter ATP-binding protein [Candidatus Baltobacteraceae bacterium]
MSIELKSVTKHYGRVSALADISFSVTDGELVALLGPSGSGKTTVLRLIAGLETPESGGIFIRGAQVNDVPVRRRNIGFVFQNYALFRNMNIARNIAFGLKIKKWRPEQIHARVEELAGLLELHGLLDRYPHQLSGGQRQRVAIARALAPKPDVLLLDEPFAAVDAQIRQELRQWLVRLHHDIRLTTIFVTHDQEEAMEVSDRIVVFSQGHLEQVGTPQEVYERPRNEFVARFVGVLNVVELEVRHGVARCQELEFPAHGLVDGQKMRIGFRPYNVQVSPDPSLCRHRGVLRKTYFLGVMLRLEIELPSGLVIRSRISKEEYARLGLKDDHEVSFQIRTYRILSKEGDPLGNEVATTHTHKPMPHLGEGI